MNKFILVGLALLSTTSYASVYDISTDTISTDLIWYDVLKVESEKFSSLNAARADAIARMNKSLPTISGQCDGRFVSKPIYISECWRITRPYQTTQYFCQADCTVYCYKN